MATYQEHHTATIWEKLPLELLSGALCLVVAHARVVSLCSPNPGQISVVYVQLALAGSLLAIFALLFRLSLRRRLLCGVCIVANVMAIASFL